MLSRLKKLRRENGTSVVSFAFIAIAIVSGFIIYFSPDIAKLLGLDEKRFENVVGTVLTPTLLFIGYLIFEKSVISLKILLSQQLEPEGQELQEDEEQFEQALPFFVLQQSLSSFNFSLFINSS